MKTFQPTAELLTGKKFLVLSKDHFNDAKTQNYMCKLSGMVANSSMHYGFWHYGNETFRGPYHTDFLHINNVHMFPLKVKNQLDYVIIKTQNQTTHDFKRIQTCLKIKSKKFDEATTSNDYILWDMRNKKVMSIDV